MAHQSVCLILLLLLTTTSAVAQVQATHFDSQNKMNRATTTPLTAPTETSTEREEYIPRNVDFHLYLTDNNQQLKVRINHPTHGKLQLTLADTHGEMFYESKIDLYYQSVINISIPYLTSGKYVVDLKGNDFDEQKTFDLP